MDEIEKERLYEEISELNARILVLDRTIKTMLVAMQSKDHFKEIFIGLIDKNMVNFMPFYQELFEEMKGFADMSDLGWPE